MLWFICWFITFPSTEYIEQEKKGGRGGEKKIKSFQIISSICFALIYQKTPARSELFLHSFFSVKTFILMKLN